jgi:hypothetical protein
VGARLPMHADTCTAVVPMAFSPEPSQSGEGHAVRSSSYHPRSSSATGSQLSQGDLRHPVVIGVLG